MCLNLHRNLIKLAKNWSTFHENLSNVVFKFGQLCTFRNLVQYTQKFEQRFIEILSIMYNHTEIWSNIPKNLVKHAPKCS